MLTLNQNLYGLALEGRAPKFLRKCTKNGVPIYCFLIVMCFPFLSFLQLSNGSNQVLLWLVNLITAGGVIDFIVMCVTYLCFYRACKVQGIDRKSLPYTGWFQPYGAWIALGWMVFIVMTYGYSAFSPWNTSTFFTYYTMVLIAPVLFVFWKVLKKTSFVRPEDVDLVWEAPIIDAYEASFYEKPLGFWTEMLQLVGLGRNVSGDKRRAPTRTGPS
jgi:amino acid transporter